MTPKNNPIKAYGKKIWMFTCIFSMKAPFGSYDVRSYFNSFFPKLTFKDNI